MRQMGSPFVRRGSATLGHKCEELSNGMTPDEVFEVDIDDDGLYCFRLRVDGDIVLASLGFKTKWGCTRALALVREHATNPDGYVKDLSVLPQHQFKIRIGRNRVLGISRIYPTATEYKAGQATVCRAAPRAIIDDRTVEIARTARTEKKRRESKKKKKLNQESSTQFKLYEAPHLGNGIYGFTEGQQPVEKTFDTEAERDEFWDRQIDPNTEETDTKTDGTYMAYEYRRANIPLREKWGYVGAARYSDENLISGSPDGDAVEKSGHELKEAAAEYGRV